MTGKQFYDWQTSGGTNDVMRMVNCLEKADIPWCTFDNFAVIHWATEPMVTQDVDFVVATDQVERAVSLLEQAGFTAERYEWSVNFTGRSKVSLQLSTEEFYRDFPSRAVAPMSMVSCCGLPPSKTRFGARSGPGAVLPGGKVNE